MGACNPSIRMEVSIHAPLRGATFVIDELRWEEGGFNPRTPAGCDTSSGLIRPIFSRFQSTHPCGVRPSGYGSCLSGNKFQSTHPCGVRPITRFGRCRSKEFQSTHPCGVRQPRAQELRKSHAFQSTHPCGVRLLTVATATLSSTFQSTHPCGVRRGSPAFFTPFSGFQSTHPCGVRHKAVNLCNHSTVVSIHAPLRGATDWIDDGAELGLRFNPRTPAGCDS